MIRRMLTSLVLIALLGAGAFPAAAQPPGTRTLEVFAAASLADAFSELGRTLARRSRGLSVRFNFTGSQSLAVQLAQGANADVFASADERWMNDAADRGLLSGEPVVFARNRMVVIVPRSNPGRIQRLQHLSRPGLKVVVCADLVPAGRYSRIVLRNLAADSSYGGGFGALVLRNVVSEEDNVKSVVAKVQLGEADAGIVYRSDVTPAVARLVRIIEIPQSANVIAPYPIALLRGARQPDDARAFVALVMSAEGQRVLARHGLLSAKAARP